MKPRRALMPKTHLINGAGSILFPGNARSLYLHQPLPFMHPFQALLELEMRNMIYSKIDLVKTEILLL